VYFLTVPPANMVLPSLAALVLWETFVLFIYFLFLSETFVLSNRQQRLAANRYEK